MGNLWEVHSPSEGIKSNKTTNLAGTEQLGWMASGHTPRKSTLVHSELRHGRKVVGGKSLAEQHTEYRNRDHTQSPRPGIAGA